MTNQKGITLLGLGPGNPNLLTLEAWQVLQDAEEIYLRTSQHPTVAGFPAGLDIHSFDKLYEASKEFEDVYAQIIERILELGKRPEGVVYAVPGHPFVAETTGPAIYGQAKALNIPVHVVSGLSYLEPTFEVLGLDPLPQTAIVDALDIMRMHHPPFSPSSPALIAQVYSQRVAAEVKITLMAQYPDEHTVQLVHAAGTEEALVEELPLHKIDQSENVGLLSSLYVPPLGENTAFEDFQELIAHLRAPEGCPWDREQTHQSLRPNLLEETYEVLEAIDADDEVGMREEFGDLLLQIVLHAQIAAEYGEFTMSDVIQDIHTKLVARHPHVFGELELDEAGAVELNWEALKAKERQANGTTNKGILDGVSLDLPSLAQAQAYQARAARVGFDWPDVSGVLDKVGEELEELRVATNEKDYAEEFGDLLFVMVNFGRWKKMDVESTLRAANAKFKRRFAYIEQQAQAKGRDMKAMSLDEMDTLWEEAKKL